MTIEYIIHFSSAIVGLIAFGLWYENKPKSLMWIWLIALGVFLLTKA